MSYLTKPEGRALAKLHGLRFLGRVEDTYGFQSGTYGNFTHIFCPHSRLEELPTLVEKGLTFPPGAWAK